MYESHRKYSLKLINKHGCVLHNLAPEGGHTLCGGEDVRCTGRGGGRDDTQTRARGHVGNGLPTVCHRRQRLGTLRKVSHYAPIN